MPDLKNSRSAGKGTLTRAYGDLSVLVAENDYDGVVSQRQKMKALYRKFLESHTDYHETLEGEGDIKASDEYFCNVKALYAGQQNVAKAALKDVQPLSQTGSEPNNEQSLAALGHLINLPPLELQKFSGEPDEFDNFIATFNEVIGNVISDPAAKLLRLRRRLLELLLMPSGCAELLVVKIRMSGLLKYCVTGLALHTLCVLQLSNA